ncbi:MAG: hypothetical protein KDK27_05800, partial [Leptospiraceae bacterium]|nr:hypothetical protein [Leptospiraceae bacterium]
GGGGGGTPVFYIYTNSLTVTGNLGSRATSTSSCQSMQTASYPAMTCTNYLAVASYPGDDLLNASTNHSVPAGRTLTSESGTTVASSWSAFLTGPTVTLQTAGVANTTPTPFYWTSTAIGGGFDATYNCTNNSDGTNGAVGSQGAITTTAGTHIRFAVNQPCDGSTNSAYLMCICWN